MKVFKDGFAFTAPTQKMLCVIFVLLSAPAQGLCQESLLQAKIMYTNNGVDGAPLKHTIIQSVSREPLMATKVIVNNRCTIPLGDINIDACEHTQEYQDHEKNLQQCWKEHGPKTFQDRVLAAAGHSGRDVCTQEVLQYTTTLQNSSCAKYTPGNYQMGDQVIDLWYLLLFQVGCTGIDPVAVDIYTNKGVLTVNLTDGTP